MTNIQTNAPLNNRVDGNLRLPLLAAMLVSTAIHATDVPISVSLSAPSTPTAVTAMLDNSALEVALAAEAGKSNVYVGSLKVRPNNDATVLYSNYIVSAQWPEMSESIYVAITDRATESSKWRFQIMRLQADATLAGVEAIEIIGKTTMTDQLTRFFKARVFVRAMLVDSSVARNPVTLRGVRQWFDAAYWLASRVDTPYRMDPTIVQYVEDYFEQAKTDGALRARLAQILPRSYFDDRMREVRASQYKLVAEVSRLNVAGELAAAQNLNTRLLNSLKAESNAGRIAAAKTQGVTVKLLEANASYLSQLSDRM